MVLLVQLSHYATAQTGQLLFRHISRSAGLPVDQVTSIAQDSSGFIWIGSTEGLFRYDGFSFKAFYAEPGNSKTLPENIITKIFVSSKGLIWIGTKGGGICCMQKDGRIFQTFNTANTSSITSLGNHITEIKEDKKGNIWWSSVDGIFKLSPNAKKPECYKIKSSNVRVTFSIAC
jgi:ligand-binding sensor domain-containing protein